ncbi:putative P450 monooxygenase [Aspergillus venezuelensis]
MDAFKEATSKTLEVFTFCNIILALISLVFAQCVYQIVYYRFFHPLRHYPGPFWASVTRLWGAYHFIKGDKLDLEWHAIKKYGPIIRTSPTMLLVADSTLMPAIYHRRDTKARFYLSEMFETSGSLVIRDPAKHAAHRRLISATYSMSNIKRMEPLLDKHILHFLEKLDNAYAQNAKPMDFSTWAAYLSYDTVTDLGFRNPLGFVDSASDVGGLIYQFRLGMLLFGTSGYLYPFFRWLTTTWLKKSLIIRPEQALGFGVVMKRANEVLEERKRALQEGRTVKAVKGDASYDFLQAFMDTRTPEGEYLDNKTIRAEVFVILGAGADGFSSLSSAFIAEVLSRPSVYQRVMAEIKAAAIAGEFSQPVPRFTEITKNLPFFLACMQEVFRLHPTGATQLPREITPNDPDLVLSGRKVPVGTEVTCNPWIINRDYNIYGDDAEVFNPNRWLGGPEQIKLFEKHSLTWGHGARVCLGRHMAQMMLYKSLVTFLMYFEVSICEETSGTPKLESEIYGPVLCWKNVWLSLRKRESWEQQYTV